MTPIAARHHANIFPYVKKIQWQDNGFLSPISTYGGLNFEVQQTNLANMVSMAAGLGFTALSAYQKDGELLVALG